jgi:hypothetical protein
VTSWTNFEASLDSAAARGRRLRYWWRDDDAGRHHPDLDRLLELAETLGVPLGLAVVPSWLSPTAQARIAASNQVTVLQHGFAHINHAAEGDKAVELGNRCPAVILEELREGRDILADAFGAAFRPVLVPPWNRIDEALLPELRSIGFSGISTSGLIEDSPVAAGIGRINIHVDPVNWHGGRGFAGEEQMLDCLNSLLDADEPIGLLSHHLAMDEPCWAFFERLLKTLLRHPAAKIQAAGRLFDRAPRGPYRTLPARGGPRDRGAIKETG